MPTGTLQVMNNRLQIINNIEISRIYKSDEITNGRLALRDELITSINEFAKLA